MHSQVSPGFTREFVNRFGKLLDEKNLQVYYQVETLVFGNAVKRALEPERYIIGCVDANAELSTAYRALLRKFDCPILQMRYESAELAKISINMFLVSSVTTTNSIAELCENIGADWEEIAGALRLDRRIGQHAYLKPGLGIAGGNLERDLVTFQNFAARYGTDSGVVESWIENSRYRAGWVLRVLHEIVFSIKTKPRIAIWGVAYKAGTHSVKNSPSLGLIETLTSFDLCVCDPVVSPSCVEGAGVEWAESALDCCRAADVLVIMTPWPEYSELDPTLVAQAMAGKLVIDPYTALDRLSCESAGLEYKSLGVAVSQDQFLADGKSKESDK